MVQGEWNFTSEMEIKCDPSSIRFNCATDCADRRVRCQILYVKTMSVRSNVSSTLINFQSRKKGTFSFFWLHPMVISKMNVDKIVYTRFRELALWQIRLWVQGGWTNLPLWSYKTKWLPDM